MARPKVAASPKAELLEPSISFVAAAAPVGSLAIVTPTLAVSTLAVSSSVAAPEISLSADTHRRFEARGIFRQDLGNFRQSVCPGIVM